MTMLATHPALGAMTDTELSAAWSADEITLAELEAECARRDQAGRARAASRERNAEWEAAAYAQYLAADERTRGNLLSAAGERTGRGPWPLLWQGGEDAARRLASEELITFWDYESPRVPGPAVFAAGTRESEPEPSPWKEAITMQDTELDPAQGAEPVTGRPEAPQVNGAAILDEARDFISRFAVLPSAEALDAMTLWCAHTHAFRAFAVTPRLALLSDEPASGKTRLLDLLTLLTARPEMVVDPTGPVVFILIKECSPTLLMDECDQLWGRSGGAAKRQVLAVLNSGYKQGATVPRARKDSVERFPVFCPVAFAGLGRLPDTLMTRSVIVRMRQRRKHETCDAYMPRMHAPLGLATGAALASWTASVLPELASAWPAMPDGVQDRSAEIWEPLLSIAEQAGGHWPASARKACEALVLGAGGKPVRAPSLQLLDDVALVWPAGESKMATAELVRLLMDIPGTERAWEPAAAPRELAAMLRPHGIAPVKIRLGERTVQGYQAADIPTLAASRATVAA